jgi:hypothetical protein
MRKSLVVVLTAGALVSANLAWAAPRALSSTELDRVAAGTGVADAVLGHLSTAPVLGVADNGALNIVGDENSVPTASAHELAVAGEANVAAALDANAIDGDDNQANTGEGNVNVNDIENGALAFAAGSTAIDNPDDSPVAAGVNNAAIEIEGNVQQGAAVIAGDGNLTTAIRSVDIRDLDDAFAVVGIRNETVGVIDNDDSNVVVAEEVCVSDSFNLKEIDIDVEIKDSFNVVEKSLCVSGQDAVTAIVLANTLGEQMIGVNLNVTSATAATPAGESSYTVPGLQVGVAIANTNLVQTVINNSLLLADEFNIDIDFDIDVLDI